MDELSLFVFVVHSADAAPMNHAAQLNEVAHFVIGLKEKSVFFITTWNGRLYKRGKIKRNLPRLLKIYICARNASAPGAREDLKRSENLHTATNLVFCFLLAHCKV